MTEPRWPEGVTVTGPITPEYQAVLTPAALSLIARLQRAFNSRRLELLHRRAERQLKIDRGDLPDFLPETAPIRSDRSWRVAPIPPDLQRPPCRDHRPHRAQDADQRAQLGGRCVYGGL